jgi:hypothetical protein
VSPYALEEAAIAAIRVNDSYFAAQYRRLKPRRGHKKALGAVKHSMIWHMLSTARPTATSAPTTSPPATPNARPAANRVSTLSAYARQTHHSIGTRPIPRLLTQPQFAGALGGRRDGVAVRRRP